VQRRRTSPKPDLARGLHAAGVGVGRVAALLGVSEKYVYMALQNKR